MTVMHSLERGPGWYKKADGARHGDQASEQHLSMASASISVFRFLFEVPAWTSLSDGM